MISTVIKTRENQTDFDTQGFKSLPLHFFHPYLRCEFNQIKGLNKQGHFIQNDVAVFVPVPFHSHSILVPFFSIEWNGMEH
jgi:hypothetical protein